MTTALALAAVLALACGQGRVDPSDDAGGSDLPSEYQYSPEEGSDPVFDDQAIADGIQDALLLALQLTGDPIVEGYFAMLDYADDSCPNWYEQDGNVFWYDYCQADSGALFDGYGSYYPYVDADLDGSGTLYTGDYLYGVASITASDGTWFHSGGGTQVLYGRDEEADSWTAVSQVMGGFAWTDPAAQDSWLGQELEPDLYLYSVEYSGYDARGVYVDGGISGLEGDATAVLFEGNLIYDEALDSPCPLEPTGDIQLRDADGHWWVVAFDTPDEGTLSQDLCDGCGTVSYAGDEVGEVCIDFSPWLDWEVYAW